MKQCESSSEILTNILKGKKADLGSPDPVVPVVLGESWWSLLDPDEFWWSVVDPRGF